MPQDEQERHRMDIDMSIKSIGWVFALTVAGLLAIFYAFVSPEGLPSMQNLTFVLVGVGVASLPAATCCRHGYLSAAVLTDAARHRRGHGLLPQ
jgi:uncharacterized oligopeptide transporter (OPT) family protein